jgi:cytochrome c553
VPDQSASLPGLLSASDAVEGRAIADVPVYVTGPAARACGSCHKVELINEDAAGELTIFNLHTQQGGYMVEGGEDETSTLMSVIGEIMAVFGK